MKTGVISYLLRHHGTVQAMDFLHDLGYEYTELDYRHADGLTDFHNIDIKGAAYARRLCTSHGVTPLAYCVGGLSKSRDQDCLKNVFEFARGLEVEVITGVLDPELLPDLDTYCEAYKIHYAIENHHGNVFEAAGTILKALDGHSGYIGANPDTGHFYSVGLDPLEEVKKLSGRIYNLHFKDSDQELPFGKGGVDLAGVYKELKRQGYDRMVSIEHYEYDGVTDDRLTKGLALALGYVQGLERAAS
ncbi:MAG: sugar phosphate isomerase/epimerase family protein [Omnitrophica WOR_2 bacterium]